MEKWKKTGAQIYHNKEIEKVKDLLSKLNPNISNALLEYSKRPIK